MNDRGGELTDIFLFMVLDEFSELKVASDDGHLETRASREEEMRPEDDLVKSFMKDGNKKRTSKEGDNKQRTRTHTHTTCK